MTIQRHGMSEREYAQHASVSRGAVQKARASGRLVLHADGSIDAAASDARRASRIDLFIVYFSCVRGTSRIREPNIAHMESPTSIESGNNLPIAKNMYRAPREEPINIGAIRNFDIHFTGVWLGFM